MLEEVVQAILRTDDAPAVGRQAGLQNRNIPIALNLSVFCAIRHHDRAGYAGKVGDRSRPKKNSMYGVRNEGRAAA